MLHVKCRVNIDAGIEQFEHVLITLRMTRSRRVCMRKFIDNGETGMPCENCIEIHFAERRSAIFNLRTRHDRHSFGERLGFFTSVRLDNANHHFRTLLQSLLRRLQHRVGLAHARRHPEKNLELAARSRDFLAFHLREKRIRIRPFGLAHARIVCWWRLGCISEPVRKTDKDIQVVGTIHVRSMGGVEREVECKNIHTRFSKNAECTAMGMLFYQFSHLLRA